jgi:hypothetical protein
MSKFKIGAWVRHIHNPAIIVRVIFTNDEHQTFGSDWSWCSDNEDFELWRPKQNEWVIPTPSNTFSRSFEVVMFDHADPVECEPFIGKLPSWIKEAE